MPLRFDGPFKGDFARNGQQSIDHYDLVRRVVPADNLLDWHPKDG